MSDIQNLFHAAGPDDPDTDGWAEKVHARRRRNRTAAGIAGGALVVALAVPLGISVLNQPNQNVANPAVGPTPTRTATDAPAPTGPAAATAAEACAAASEATTGWAELSGGDSPVKPGATRVWLCGDQMTAGPAEPLTVGVDELAGAFLDSGEADPNQACTMEYRLSYTLAFQYGDGTLVPVTGELHGCRTLSDGATRRSGGEELYNLAVEKWQAAREGAEPTAAPAPVTCEQQASMIPADLGDLASLALCAPAADGTWTAIHDVDATLVGGIGKSVQADAVAATDAVLEYGDSTLILSDRFGGLFSMQALAGGGYTFWADDTSKVWTPPAGIAEALAAVQGN